MNPKLNVSNNEIGALAQSLRKAANRAYSKNQHGVYVTRLQNGQVTSKKEAFSHHNADSISDKLKSAGIKGLQEFATSASGTEVYSCENENGRQFVIRNGNLFQNEREKIPLMSQAYRRWDSDDQYGEIELLNLLAMLNIDQGTTISHRQMDNIALSTKTLSEVLKFICGNEIEICRSSPLTDLAILPNGTPLQVDPGNLTIKVKYTETDAIDAIQNRQADAELPPELCWIDKNGQWTQDRFFPNPFEIN